MSNIYTQSAVLHYLMQRENLSLKQLRIKLGMRLSRIRRVLEGKQKLTEVEYQTLMKEYPYLLGLVEKD